MMECKDIRPLLPEYAAGTLDGESAAQVADHLLLCPICAGELERLEQPAEEVPAPVQAAEARSFATEDPLAAQKAAALVQESPAEDAASAEAPAPAAAPKKKLRRRTKVLLAVSALLVVLVAGLVLLWQQEVFSITARAKAPQGDITGVVYKGYKQGADGGFRVRLRDGAAKEWVSEALFRGYIYEQAVWSPDGRWLAVEYTDADGTGGVYVMDAQGEEQGFLSLALMAYTGVFNITPATIQGNLSVEILQWLPDSSALLVSGTAQVGESDPNYGVMPLQSGENGSQTIAGYFVYDPKTGTIQSHGGFLRQEDNQQSGIVASRLYNWREGIDYDGSDKISFYYGIDALKQLALLERGGSLQVLEYLGEDAADGNYFEWVGTERATKLQTPEEVILMVVWAEGGQGHVIRKSYLVLSWYAGGAK